MICRNCMRRLPTRALVSSPSGRQFSSSPRTQFGATPASAFQTSVPSGIASSASPPVSAIRVATSGGGAATTAKPKLSTVTGAEDGEAGEGKQQLSSCAAGTPLNGLNYFKGKTDPKALTDEQYPAWLWRCLDRPEKAGEGEDRENAAAEFSKSQKVRQAASKARRKKLAALVATGDLSALEPQIPLQRQTVNLPGAGDGSVADAARADASRTELRNAMRAERRAAINERNYLSTL